MREPAWVSPAAVLAIRQMLLAEHGGAKGLRDQKLLDSALARPQHKFSYDEDVSIFSLAASYSFGLARNHAFIDGNKRIALTVAAVFLELNKYSLNAPEGEAVVVYKQLADGSLSEDMLAEWFKSSSIRVA